MGEGAAGGGGGGLLLWLPCGESWGGLEGEGVGESGVRKGVRKETAGRKKGSVRIGRQME